MTYPFNPRDVLQQAFPGILDTEADQIISSGKVLSFSPDRIICKEGSYEDTFYIVLDGEVQVSQHIEGSESRILKHLKPGDFFGEMAIIHKAARAATITATQPSSVLEIASEAFASMLDNSKNISLAIIKEVSRRLRENDQRTIEILRLKNKELHETYQQLTHLEQSRHEFLTTIAHELRTPLMVSNGFLQVIRMGGIQGEALNSALETIARNFQEIISLTNNILFVQEMDLIMPEFRPTDIGAVVASVVEQQRTHAANNSVGVNLNISPNLLKIRAESPSLERAFSAILDNAIKFSPDGGEVLVEVSRDATNLKVKIQDHGVGIPEEAMSRIFERFFHIDKLDEHLFRGAGLGLSIARQVIEQHQGKIEVESIMGKGSTFTVYLPG